MTIDETVAEIDTLIDRYLVALERRVRLDLAATGPENQDALDRPPEPDAAWRRITVEELLMIEAQKLQTWRAGVLARMRGDG